MSRLAANRMLAKQENGQGSAETTRSAAQPSWSVLVVDDEPLLRAMLRLILVRAGFNVLEAEDGLAALALAKEALPDLLIVDVMMPEMDGYGLCDELGRDARTSALPIIMLSAKVDERSRHLGLKAGARKYLTKPVMPQELVRCVSEVIKGHQQESGTR